MIRSTAFAAAAASMILGVFTPAHAAIESAPALNLIDCKGAPKIIQPGQPATCDTPKGIFAGKKAPSLNAGPVSQYAVGDMTGKITADRCKLSKTPDGLLVVVEDATVSNPRGFLSVTIACNSVSGITHAAKDVTIKVTTPRILASGEYERLTFDPKTDEAQTSGCKGATIYDGGNNNQISNEVGTIDGKPSKGGYIQTPRGCTYR